MAELVESTNQPYCLTISDTEDSIKALSVLRGSMSLPELFTLSPPVIIDIKIEWTDRAPLVAGILLRDNDSSWIALSLRSYRRDRIRIISYVGGRYTHKYVGGCPDDNFSFVRLKDGMRRVGAIALRSISLG